MLVPTLRWHSRDRAFKHLQEGVLNALPHVLEPRTARLIFSTSSMKRPHLGRTLQVAVWLPGSAGRAAISRPRRRSRLPLGWSHHRWRAGRSGTMPACGQDGSDRPEKDAAETIDGWVHGGATKNPAWYQGSSRKAFILLSVPASWTCLRSPGRYHPPFCRPEFPQTCHKNYHKNGSSQSGGYSGLYEVEDRGLEPLTSCMPCKRSPS